MSILTLEELKDTVEVFSPHQCGFFSESCIVALESNSHTTGCNLNVTGDSPTTFEINWTSQVLRAGYQEKKKYIEHGAEAIAFFLSVALTEFDVIEEAPIGTGFDYWLGYTSKHIKYDPKNFLLARLEVSGINRETPSNTLAERVSIKKKQTTPTDNTKLPAYIAVVEFSTPKAHFEKK